MKNKLLLMFIAAFIRVFPFGLTYYPQLDDYIQYGAYPCIDNAYMTFKLYAFRPLAGLFDIYVWGRLWDKMWIALFIITALHVLSCWFFMKAGEKYGYSLGIVFAACYLLFPLNIEGAYWISASTRIIVPLFFCSLALLFLGENKYKRFTFFQLMSFLFYEQVLAFSAMTSFLLSAKKRDKKGIFITLINSAAVVVYYIIFASAGGRTEFTLFNKGAFSDILQSWNLSGVFNIKTAGVWYMLMAVMVSVLWWENQQSLRVSLCKTHLPFTLKGTSHKGGLGLLFGITIILASYLPLAISGVNGVAMRSAFVPLIGVAVLADYICGKARISYIIAPMLVAVFLISSHSQIDGYRENYFNDRQLVEYVWENTVMGVPNVIVNNEAYYINQGYNFKEHIKSIVSSDWAITGAVREYAGDLTLPYYLFTPPTEGEYNVIDLGAFREGA